MKFFQRLKKFVRRIFVDYNFINNLIEENSIKYLGQVSQISDNIENQLKTINEKIDKVVMHYAKNTQMAGLDGVVCSPLEAGKVKEICGNNFLTITPGVRFETDDVIEMMLAGATAVEVGAANLKNPYACKEIIEDLPNKMKKYGIENLKDIIGVAHK